MKSIIVLSVSNQQTVSGLSNMIIARRLTLNDPCHYQCKQCPHRKEEDDENGT